MTNYKAVIFDLDGTLLNTLQDIANATNHVLIKHNLPIHELTEFRNFIGNGIPQLVYNAIPEEVRINDTMRNLLITEVLAEYAKNLDKYTQPYSGVDSLLEQLNTQGVLFAILSNKAHQFMSDVVKTYFPNYQFEAVFGIRVGIPPKPDPYSALEIAEIMNLLPAQIIFVGDSPIDMRTAQNSGMFAIGVSWGFGSKDELIANGAKAIIDQPHELMNYFSNN